MNDLTNVIRPFLVILLAIVMYVVVVQLTNDSACASLDKPYSVVAGKWLIKALALCWW